MKNNLIGGLCAALLVLGAAGAEAGVVKTKTKSNQSNDRCASTCPISRGDAAASLGSEFDRLDLNHDGVLDMSEQASLRVSMGSSLDQAGQGLVTRDAWLASGLSLFDSIDLDHNGTLDAAEARKGGWDIKANVKV